MYTGGPSTAFFDMHAISVTCFPSVGWKEIGGVSAVWTTYPLGCFFSVETQVSSILNIRASGYCPCWHNVWILLNILVIVSRSDFAFASYVVGGFERQNPCISNHLLIVLVLIGSPSKWTFVLPICPVQLLPAVLQFDNCFVQSNEGCAPRVVSTPPRLGRDCNSIIR